MTAKNLQIVGILWMLTHCFIISLMSAMIRQVSNDFNIYQIVFFHNFVAFIAVFIYAIINRKNFQFKTSKTKLHLARSLLGVISLTMYFYSFTIIPLTQARAIALTGPLVSSIFALFYLKEKMGIYRSLSLIFGFLGALIIVRPGASDFSLVSLMVVAAVIMWSIIDIIIKLISKTESTSSQLFYLTLYMSIFSLPFAIYYWQPIENIKQLLWLTLIGLMFLINVITVFKAFKNADVTILMPFDFSGMVFTTIIAYLAFNEIVDFYTALGSVIIIISSVIITKREAYKNKKLLKPLKSEV